MTPQGVAPRTLNPAWDWAAVLAAMIFPSVMSWLEFWVLPAEAAEPQPFLAAFFVGGKVVQFAFPVLYTWLIGRASFRAFRWSRRGFGLGVALAGLIALGAFVLYFGILKRTDVFSDTRPAIERWLMKINAATPGGYAVVAALICVPHAFLEEYYWRWFVFGRLQHLVSWGLAVAVSSLAFMSHHVIVLAYYLPGRFWIAAVPFSLCVAAGGAIWAWLYHRTESLYAPWLSHLLVDAAIMIVGFDMLFGF